MAFSLVLHVLRPTIGKTILCEDLVCRRCFKQLPSRDVFQWLCFFIVHFFCLTKKMSPGFVMSDAFLHGHINHSDLYLFVRFARDLGSCGGNVGGTPKVLWRFASTIDHQGSRNLIHACTTAGQSLRWLNIDENLTFQFYMRERQSRVNAYSGKELNKSRTLPGSWHNVVKRCGILCCFSDQQGTLCCVLLRVPTAALFVFHILPRVQLLSAPAHPRTLRKLRNKNGHLRILCRQGPVHTGSIKMGPGSILSRCFSSCVWYGRNVDGPHLARVLAWALCVEVLFPSKFAFPRIHSESKGNRIPLQQWFCLLVASKGQRFSTMRFYCCFGLPSSQ